MDLSVVTNAFLAQTGLICLALTLCVMALERIADEPNIPGRIGIGLLFGVTGAILMNMSGAVVDEYYFDLRLVPVAVAGLVAGPLGSATAAFVASIARVEMGGDGTLLGLAGLWLSFAVGCLGWHGLKTDRDTVGYGALFGGMTATVAISALILMPETPRQKILASNLPAVILALNFLTAFVAACYVGLNRRRKRDARTGVLHSQVVTALPDALYAKDLEGQFILATERSAALFGAKTAADLIGRHEVEFHKRGDAWRILQEDRAFLSNPAPVTIQQVLRRADRDIFLSTVKAPYLNEAGHLQGVVCYSTDITAQKALEAELTATQHLLQTAIDEMADGLAMFDRDGRLRLWNQRYLELFPYVEDLLPAKPMLGDILRAGIMRGHILIPRGKTAVSWVEEELQRSADAQTSELLLDSDRWVAKKTSILKDKGWVTLYADITEKKLAVAELEKIANRDGLTALANRRYFDLQLQASLRDARDLDRPVSLLLLDVDFFKPFNDTYGHPAGDQILKTIASTLQACCRRRTDTVARYGGEEFAVIMPDADTALAQEAAIRLRDAVRALAIAHEASPLGRVTVSIGVATREGRSGVIATELLEECDAALYVAKCSGRDTIQIAASNPSDERQPSVLASAR
jgi:diguanylate cyclase (GGDEF)-like protein/PAS domain S-box-containing protein